MHECSSMNGYFQFMMYSFCLIRVAFQSLGISTAKKIQPVLKDLGNLNTLRSFT